MRGSSTEPGSVKTGCNIRSPKITHHEFCSRGQLAGRKGERGRNGDGVAEGLVGDGGVESRRVRSYDR